MLSSGNSKINKALASLKEQVKVLESEKNHWSKMFLI